MKTRLATLILRQYVRIPSNALKETSLVDAKWFSKNNARHVLRIIKKYDKDWYLVMISIVYHEDAYAVATYISGKILNGLSRRNKRLNTKPKRGIMISHVKS